MVGGTNNSALDEQKHPSETSNESQHFQGGTSSGDKGSHGTVFNKHRFRRTKFFSHAAAFVCAKEGIAVGWWPVALFARRENYHYATQAHTTYSMHLWRPNSSVSIPSARSVTAPLKAQTPQGPREGTASTVPLRSTTTPTATGCTNHHTTHLPQPTCHASEQHGHRVKDDRDKRHQHAHFSHRPLHHALPPPSAQYTRITQRSATPRPNTSIHTCPTTNRP